MNNISKKAISIFFIGCILTLLVSWSDKEVSLSNNESSLLVSQLSEGMTLLSSLSQETFSIEEDLEIDDASTLSEYLVDTTGLSTSEVELIISLCDGKDYDEFYLISLYHRESRFNSSVVNPYSNATGIAQFLPSTARFIAQYNDIEYKYEYLFNAEYSIILSTLYLDYLLDKYDSNLDRVSEAYAGSAKWSGKYSSGLNYKSECYRLDYIEYYNSFDSQSI